MSSVPPVTGFWGLYARASVPFQNLSSSGFGPFGRTEQGQHPPEASGRWRPLEAKGCVTRPWPWSTAKVLRGGC